MRWSLPPNPAKLSDSRAKSYIRKHRTRSSWELDAIHFDDLRGVAKTHIEEWLDVSKIEAIKTRENAIKADLMRVADTVAARCPSPTERT